MKISDSLKQIHEIMEEIYEEEKELTIKQKIKKARKESDKFLRARKLNLTRVTSKKSKKVVA